jgi:hypothetical protein
MLEDPTQTRRCPSCRELEAAFEGTTDHEVRVRAGLVPVMEVEQGSRRSYRCPRCDRTFELLDSARRGWFYYGVVVGAALVGGAAWLATGETTALTLFLAMIGLVAAGFSIVVLVRDASLRRRTAPPHDPLGE